jgi:hypothetical protein
MAEEITGGAPSGGAPSAPVSSPAPAAPASAAPASVPSAPAPVAVPSAPAAPAGPPVKGIQESDNDFLKRFHAYQDAQPKEPVAEPPKPVATEPVKPVTEPVKPATDPAKPEPVKPAAEAAAVDDQLDKLGPLPASKFAEALAAHPELETALEAAGIPKDDIFAGLREAAFAQQIKETGIVDLDSAKFAMATTATMRKMDLAATEVVRGDMGSTVNFVRDVLLPMSYVLDDEGNPRMMDVQEGGRTVQYPQTDGTVQVLIDNFRDLALEQVAADAGALLKRTDNAQAQELGQQLQDAVKAVQTYIKGNPASGEELTEELKQQKATLDARQAEMDNQRTQESEQRFNKFREDIRTGADNALDEKVTGWLGQSTLAESETDSASEKQRKEFLRNGAVKEIRDGLLARLAADDGFLAEQEQIARRGASAKTQTALVNLYKRYSTRYLENVATPVLQRAGGERVRQVQALRAKVATQEKVTQMEPRGATSPALPRTPQVNETELMRQSRTELQKELRREPNSSEMIARFRQLQAKAIAQPA